MNDNANVANKAAETGRSDAALLPAVDVIEDAGGITLYADLPGVSKDKLNLQVEADVLTIEGEVSLSTPSNMAASHVEVDVPRYQRVFTLSKELDSGKVSAELRQGVLRLRIPKAEHAQPRKIDIKVS
jgi:HSP20 family molecular chaperone IbpA